MDQASTLLKDPFMFTMELMNWAEDRDLELDPALVEELLKSTINPSAVTPTEFIAMITDQDTPLCDPVLIRRAVESKNLTDEQIEVRKCNIFISILLHRKFKLNEYLVC